MSHHKCTECPCDVLGHAPAGLLEPKVLKQILYEEAGGRLQFLGRISDAEGSLERRFFSPAHIRAGSQVRLACHQDAAAPMRSSPAC